MPCLSWYVSHTGKVDRLLGFDKCTHQENITTVRIMRTSIAFLLGSTTQETFWEDVYFSIGISVFVALLRASTSRSLLCALYLCLLMTLVGLICAETSLGPLSTAGERMFLFLQNLYVEN